MCYSPGCRFSPWCCQFGICNWIWLVLCSQGRGSWGSRERCLSAKLSILRRKIFVPSICNWSDQKLKEFERLQCCRWQWDQIFRHPEWRRCWKRSWSRLEERWILKGEEDFQLRHMVREGLELPFVPPGSGWKKFRVCRGRTVAG